jgi:hypothetical protein
MQYSTLQYDRICNVISIGADLHLEPSKTRILISFSLFICTTQHSRPMAASRKKVQLEPGHTLADWYRLVQSGEDLGGAPRALRIPIEEVN